MIAACDRAAASHADPNRPAGVAGVVPWKIDAAVAVPACEAAVKAAPDDARMLYQLGRAYGAAKSYAAAVAQYTKADQLGYGPATFNLAGHYKNGSGVAADLSRAKALLDKAKSSGALASMKLAWEVAAASGDTDAMVALGWAHEWDWGLPKDYGIARGWFEKAAAGGNASAMTSIGVHYESGFGVSKDVVAARGWYEKAAALGDAAAMRNLGILHAYGLGTPLDYAAARDWWEKAANARDTKAMMDLAWLHWAGKGVPKDDGIARGWYEKAASQGDAAAMERLGYMSSSGTPVDYVAARDWWEKAANIGNTLAMMDLGWLHAEGKGREYRRTMGSRAAGMNRRQREATPPRW